MKNFFKWIYIFFTSFFRKENGEIVIKTKLKNIINVEKTLAANKRFLKKATIDNRKKATRNQNKCYATTISFNSKKTLQIKKDESPVANSLEKQYLKLQNRKKILDAKGIRNRILRKKYGKVMSLSDFMKSRSRNLRLSI